MPQVDRGYIDMFWLSSEDDFLADLLSRCRLEEFWHRVSVSGFWATPHYEGVRCYPDTGKPRTFRSPTQTEGTYSSSVNKDGPGAGARGSQSMSVPHSRASIWDGLPGECHSRVEQLMDRRLGASSLRSMSAALKLWMAVCTMYFFDPVIRTDDSLRGGQVVAFVMHMVADTEFVWASIENYVWAWREWMVLQRQADPIMGVMGWDRFWAAVKVMTIVAGEPRLAMPLADIEKVLRAFYEVQFGFFR